MTRQALIRRTITDQRMRDLEYYTVFIPDDLIAFGQAAQTAGTEPSWVMLPTGEHVLLSDCYDSDYLTLSYQPQHGWAVDGGAVHGIPLTTAPETTLLAIFPSASSPPICATWVVRSGQRLSMRSCLS